MLDEPTRQTADPAVCTRLCPSPEGETRALITHSIDVATCLARQRDFYHKCHRCRYRGRPASFVLEEDRAGGGGAVNGAQE